MPSKNKYKKTRHAKIKIPNWAIPVSVISVISAGLFYAASATNNTSTIVTTLPDTYTITGSSIELDLSSVIELPSSGWSDDSDRISIEVSITNGSADNAIVDRSTDVLKKITLLILMEMVKKMFLFLMTLVHRLHFLV
jgi:hypothetical protein